ncbi:MAG: protein-S-isoprenylcysteine O-methyltransferase [Pseudomonadota bacterium]
MIGKLIPYLIMAATLWAALWRQAPYEAFLLLALMTAWYTTRIALTSYDPTKVTQERDAKRERPLASAVGFAMVIGPVLTLATPLFDFAAYSVLPGQIVAGTVMGLAGLYIFYRSHADLGEMWSAHLELREQHRLITQGIYARMRHPMYTAIFLICASQALILANWLTGPLAFIVFWLLYVTRIRSEEQMMADTFGSAWESYAAETPRLLPKISR